MPMHARVLSAANRTEACLPRAIEPTSVRLVYEDTVVVAVVEPIGRDKLVVQYTVEDDFQARLEIWSALLHYDVVAGRWRLRTRSADKAHRSAIATVCRDVLRAIHVSPEQAEVQDGPRVGEGR